MNLVAGAPVSVVDELIIRQRACVGPSLDWDLWSRHTVDAVPEVPADLPDGSVELERVLATVLFTDIVRSTELAAALGDRRWRALIERHHAVVRRELGRHRGRELDTAGDGFFTIFDGPARAIHCACAVRDAVGALGITIRAGLHTGECKRIGDKIGGIAVHIGARVAAAARPGEVLVSCTMKDLVVGSDLRFADRGAHVLRGVPGEWRLYAVER
jgi:class 3 adenylate cyclase